MAGVQIIRFRSSQYPAREGIIAAPMLTEANGACNLSSGITTFARDASVQIHSHNTEEMLAILQGKALIEAEGKQFEAEPFDVCYLPAGSFHRVTNVGDSEMRILWTYGSTRPVRVLGDEGRR